jgi:flagellar biosynthetic protein FlhB
MSEESEDDASKTEEPTHKRLEDARKKGQVVSTRELNHFFMMLALTFFLMVLAPRFCIAIMDILTPFISRPDQFEVTSAGVKDTLSNVLGETALIMAIPLILLSFVAAIAPAVIQGKLIVSGESIKPKLNKISPLAGFKRIYGMKALVEFMKSFLKVAIIGTVGIMVALPYASQMERLLTTDKSAMLELTQQVAGSMMIAACIFLFLLSIFDYAYQRMIFMKQMRMTKQELKDEYKQQEGDPLVKNKVRQLRRERAKKRMMANVPKADVIITNPTHYAVALQYDSATMPAPKVLAKGIDDVALRIRELGTKNKIPVVRNPPLARILYDTTEIDDEIPTQHYQAVAKIIGYVYKLKGKTPQKTPAGKTSAKTSNRPILKMRK